MCSCVHISLLPATNWTLKKDCVSTSRETPQKRVEIAIHEFIVSLLISLVAGVVQRLVQALAVPSEAQTADGMQTAVVQRKDDNHHSEEEAREEEEVLPSCKGVPLRKALEKNPELTYCLEGGTQSGEVAS